jgi:DNA-binding FadR family transcriptional regulator
MRIDAILERMEDALDDGAVALACDRDFHTAIADITGNSALKHLTGLIYSSRMSPYFKKLAWGWDYAERSMQNRRCSGRS